MHHGISAALLGVLILLPATPASAQSRNDFAYWDTSGNGDLTCAEAEDRDEGLRLPAYRDNRDGTGIIYEWLERSRSSDGNNDGVACDSASHPNGYIPNAQVEPPVEPQACSADAETWRGLQVCDERPRDGYDRDAFGTGYSNLEDDIIAALPPTMKATGQVYTPYSCLAFDITADGTAATDIEHIVALAETHDSGIADERRRDIASDLDNLTIADPTVNRSEKSDRDAAEWMPARHGTYLFGSLIVFYFSGLTMTALLRKHLKDEVSWERYRGSYDDVQPYVLNAFSLALDEFDTSVQGDILRRELRSLLTHLCHPILAKRAYGPPGVVGTANDMERVVSRLDFLAQRVSFTF